MVCRHTGLFHPICSRSVYQLLSFFLYLYACLYILLSADRGVCKLSKPVAIPTHCPAVTRPQHTYLRLRNYAVEVCVFILTLGVSIFLNHASCHHYILSTGEVLELVCYVTRDQ